MYTFVLFTTARTRNIYIMNKVNTVTKKKPKIP